MNDSATPRIEDLLVHGAWLRRLAASLVHSASEAEDLVQETWLAALVRGPARGEEARAWLARVLRNQAASRARASGARDARERRSARAEGLPSAEVLAERADLSRRLVELVLELPSDQQRILLARYFEGLSSAEIARRLDRPEASVRSQLKRGLDQLRRRLDADSEGQRERWLGALTPLTTLPRAGEAGLGSGLALLAVGGGAKLAAALGLAALAAGILWMTRAPATPPGSTLVAEPAAPDLDEVDSVEAPAAVPTEPVPAAGRVAQNEPQAAAAVVERPIEGRLVHPRTREPVVWFELGIVPEALAAEFAVAVTAETELPETEALERVRTDERGRFATERGYATGGYALVPVEDWTMAQPPMEPFRIRQPRPPMELDHDAERELVHEFELETGPVYTVDCPKALELGAASMVAIYSYIDHFPPGYFRPSRLQTDPTPFVRMHPDWAKSHASKVTNLRLVSVDGLWSGSVPASIPDSIATQHVRFELEARARLSVGLDFGERRPPPFLELHFWRGAVQPLVEGAPEPDIRELQAKFDGTELDEAVLMYAPTGLATVGIQSSASEYWHQVVEILPGEHRLEAALRADPAATGRVEGRVVHVDPGRPEPIVGAILSGDVDGAPSFHTQRLEFVEQGGLWVADFAFTHLPVTEYMLWFDKGGPVTADQKAFTVEPQMTRTEVDGPPLEFELHTDLTRTRLRVSARDALTGERIKAFAVSVFVPNSWMTAKHDSAKTGRATLNLLGSVEGGLACVAAKGYVRRDVPLSEAEPASKGLELELELTPGWGGPVYAYDDANDGPLEGVRVLLDGVEHGVTDANGQVRVEAPVRPERVDFVREGYEVLSQSGLIDGEGRVLDLEPVPIEQQIGVRLRQRP